MADQPNARWRRILRWVVRGVVVFVLLLVLITALAAWRLARGPISLAGITPRAEEALDKVVDPNTVTIDDVVLTWSGWRKPLDVKALGVALRSPSGEAIARFEELGVDFFLPALLRGRVVPVSIELQGLRLSVTRKADGKLDVGFAGATETRSEGPGGVRVKEWIDGTAEGPLGRLDHIRLTGASLTVDDRVFGLSWGGADLDLKLDRDRHGVDVDLGLKIRIGDEEVPTSLSGQYERASGDVQGRLGFSGLAPSLVADVVPSMKVLSDLKDPVTGTIEGVAHRDGNIEISSFDFDSLYGRTEGSLNAQISSKSFTGVVNLHDLHPWVLGEALAPAAPLTAVRVPVDGQVEFDIADLHPRSIGFNLTAGAGSLEIPAPLTITQRIVGADVEGRIQELNTFELQSAAIDLGGGVIVTLEGDARLGDGTITADATAGIDAITLQRIATLWPAGIADGVHTWIAEHLPNGEVHDIKVVLGVAPAGGKTALRRLEGGFSYVGLRLDLFPEAPPIQQITGSATFNAHEFDFKVGEARLVDLAVTEASAIISNLDDPPTKLEVDAVVDGPVGSALALINGKPLDLVNPSIIAAPTVGGSATTKLQVALPLDGPRSGEVSTFDVRSHLAAFSWSKAPFGLRVTEGDLELHADARGFEVTGSSELNGVPTDITYNERFGDSDLLRTVEATANVDPAAITALGLPEIPFYDGTSGIDVSVAMHRDGTVRVEGTANLGAADIDVPQIGWSKPGGQPAQLTVDATRTPGGGWAIDPVSLQSDELSAEARAELGGNPAALDRLTLRSFKLGRSDLGAVLTRQHEGYAIDIEGGSFDLAPLVRYLDQGDGSHKTTNKPTPPLEISVHLDHLYGARASEFASVAAEAAFNGRAWERITLHGSTLPEGGISLTAAPDAAGYAFQLHVDNVGKVADALALDSHFEGGTLDVTAGGASEQGPITGHLEVRNTRLTQSTMTTRLLRLASFHGLLATFTSSGLHIIHATTDLSYEHKKLTFSDLRVNADGAGIVANGDFNFAAGEVDVHGTLAPIHTLQKIIGHLPVLGRVLTGVHREGVIVAQFSITGKFAKPEVKAQPLSVLTPGITRDLVRLIKSDKTEKEPHSD